MGALHGKIQGNTRKWSGVWLCVCGCDALSHTYIHVDDGMILLIMKRPRNDQGGEGFQSAVRDCAHDSREDYSEQRYLASLFERHQGLFARFYVQKKVVGRIQSK